LALSELLQQKALRAENIECIVAPYEADAQLGYLSISGYVDAVISEDSDLLAYGCNRVLFKMDKFGNGEEINLDRLVSNCQFFLLIFSLVSFLVLKKKRKT